MRKKFLMTAALLCMVVTMSACGNTGNASTSESDKDNSQSSVQMESTENAQGDSQDGLQSEMGETEDASESETTIETEESESQSESESQNTGNSQTSNNTQNPSNTQTPNNTQPPSNTETTDGTQKPSDTQTPSSSQTPEDSQEESESEVVEDEILGAGSKDQPYEIIPEISEKYMTVVTESVPAGKSLYYKIQRIGGMDVVINDANAYMIESDGTEHYASNGKVAFRIEEAMATDYVLVQIGNAGSTAKSFTLTFTNPEGTQANPTILTNIGTYTISVEEGNETGHYYKYVVQQEGTLRFYINEETVESGITVTNNRNSAQRNFEGDLKTDDAGKEYIELEVKVGDEIIIQVHAIPTSRFKYKATTVTWEMKY